MELQGLLRLSPESASGFVGSLNIPMTAGWWGFCSNNLYLFKEMIDFSLRCVFSRE